MSDVPRKDKKSEGEEKSVKVALCNEEKSDSYKGLEIFDGAGEGSEVRMIEEVNDNTSLDACKGPPTLEVGKNPADEISLESDNYGSKSNNDCVIDIEDPEDESTDKSSPLGM